MPNEDSIVEGEVETAEDQKTAQNSPPSRARAMKTVEPPSKPCTDNVHDQPDEPSKPCTDNVHDQQSLDGSDDDGDSPEDIRRAVDRHRCYQLYVYERKSMREIERETGIERRKVRELIVEEAAVRADERKAVRSADIEKSTAVYEKVRDRQLARMDSDNAKGDEARYVIAAQERIDKLHGYDEPIKVDPGESPIESAILSFKQLDPQTRATLLRVVAAKRAALTK